MIPQVDHLQGSWMTPTDPLAISHPASLKAPILSQVAVYLKDSLSQLLKGTFWTPMIPQVANLQDNFRNHMDHPKKKHHNNNEQLAFSRPRAKLPKKPTKNCEKVTPGRPK